MKTAIAQLKDYSRTKSPEQKRIFSNTHASIGAALDKIFGVKEDDKIKAKENKLQD
jgi:hypothetical protein